MFPRLHPRKTAARLSCDYDIVAEWRMEVLGHQPDSAKKSISRRSLRAVKRQFLSHYFASPPRWRLSVRRLGGKRILPDFCVVGPVKAGSSDLAVNMLLHPNVLIPLSKEFRERNPERWRVYYPTEVQKRRHEMRFGPSLAPYLAPALHSMDIPYNLSRVRPNAKVIITLRDPVERMYSHWKWEVFLAGKRTADSLPFLSSFSAYVDDSLHLFPSLPMFTACGLSGLQASIYWKAVEYWMTCFDSRNVLVLDVRDYFHDRSHFMRLIHDFLGLPPIPTSSSAKRTNENPLSLPPPDYPSIAKLKHFFTTHNQRLWSVIGKEFAW